jgi:hypothetical protein
MAISEAMIKTARRIPAKGKERRSKIARGSKKVKSVQ